ncbi:MAG: excinuclease ABC subunit UvrA [Clostridia bacterium]|nr:excinuclease ABC subunit UvrA [Clostridia bacterium]
MQDKIIIRGAKVNNLKNIDVTVPRDKLVVFTGLSGSGKTSLAFDTIYAEGQRRYVESLSSYARQFLGQMEKPDVEYIEGLSPAISIDQKTTSKNPRSTVGTVTEIYDYLRLLYARIGVPHCPKCGMEIKKQTVDQMIDAILSMEEGTKILLLAPVIRAKKGEHQKVFSSARKNGFVRVRVDGEMYELEEEIVLDKKKKHTIEIVVDRLIIRPDIKSRLADSLETALSLSGGLATMQVLGGEEITFSQNYACHNCGINIEELQPRSFSFNSPFGACPACSGLGFIKKIDPKLVLKHPEKSIREGAFSVGGWPVGDLSSVSMMYYEGLAKHYNFSLDTPVHDLPPHIVDIILYGTGEEKLEFHYSRAYGSGTVTTTFEGIINNLERRYRETTSDWAKSEIEGYMLDSACTECHGARLRPEILAVTVGGLNIKELTDLSVEKSLAFFDSLSLSEKDGQIAAQIIKEIRARLGFLKNVGLSYLTLSRAAGTLSGGEAQRIRLATQIGSGLMGVLYILDEPSIGLHQRDNHKLLSALKNLRDMGNTLIVVEHDEETMYEADHIVDIGPGAGVHGGEIVAEGTVEEIKANPHSETGLYLSGKKKIPVPTERRKVDGRYLTVRGARQNNLKNIDVSVPLGMFVCVTGVSGSGKSSLVNEILYKSLASALNGAHLIAGDHDRIEGMEHLDKVIAIDQSPIGKTPRSNPATYTGLFTDIRNIFATANEAKARGYGPGRFSFNVKGGRCEACAGDGIIKIEMHFLPDVYVPCEVCKGKRYNRETLEVTYKGKNIFEVLDMTVEEALGFFENHPRIKRKLQTLYDVGLGYIKLGQPSTLLSGGEAQRVKLATELSKRSTGKTVYILDEPTTGLHMADVHRLVDLLGRLVEGGNTVIVIEHNLDVIKTADYILDMGPEGGDGGGTLVAAGTPEEVAKNKKSFTGQYLSKVLYGDWKK